MANVQRDGNKIPGILATSNADSTTAIPVFADSVTNRMLVNATITGSIVATPASNGATGSAVPAQADYQGINIAGTLRGVTGVNPSGSVYAIQSDITSVGGTTFALGQQLAATSLPVVLTAAQITTLTPPAAITNYANETGGNLATIAQAVVAQGTALGSTKINLVAGSVTTNAPTFVTGNVNQLSLTPAGGLRIDLKDSASNTNNLNVNLAASAATVTVSGTVTTSPPANASTNVAQFGGTNVINGGTAGIQSIGGSTATNVALTENPLNLGAQAVSSENAAITTARKAQMVTDLVGKLIVLPYANPENFVNGTTAAIVDTTSTSTIAAQGAGVRTYITSILVTNSHATVGTFVKILDNAAIVWEGYAAAAGGGFSATFPTPLRCSTNVAVNTQCVTTGANVICSIAGYKGI